MNIGELAKAYLIAKERYERAVRILIRTALVPEDKTEFWDFIEKFHGFVRQNTDKSTAFVRKGIEQTVSHFLRVDQSSLPCLIATYGKLKSSLHRKLAFVQCEVENYVEVIDSLPLAGKKACLRLMSGEPKNMVDVVEIIEPSFFESSRFLTAILHSDNMIEQQLEEIYVSKLADLYAQEDGDFLLQLENVDP